MKTSLSLFFLLAFSAVSAVPAINQRQDNQTSRVLNQVLGGDRDAVAHVPALPGLLVDLGQPQIYSPDELGLRVSQLCAEDPICLACQSYIEVGEDLVLL